MKVIMAGGGTGGHINPAISIADYICMKHPDAEIRFVGTERGLEKKLVPAAGYPIEYIDIRGFERKKIWRNVSVIMKLISANRDCVKMMKKFKPDAVVCTGGYVSGPVAMAAKHCGVPALIHEQNVYPGMTVKGAQRYVDYVAVSFEETMDYLQKEKCVVTGNPIRPEILAANSQEARKKLGISEKPFVLIFGGSLGADVINKTVIGMLKQVISEGKFQLLFGTGDRNYEAICAELKKEGIVLNDEVRVVPYINNMADVMAAADLVVARSGAITVSEISVLKKASILIPSPNVVRNHQEQNARAFEKKNAAIVICEHELTSDYLYERIVGLTENSAQLHQMEENVAGIAKSDALERLYQLVKKMTKQ